MEWIGTVEQEAPAWAESCLQQVKDQSFSFGGVGLRLKLNPEMRTYIPVPWQQFEADGLDAEPMELTVSSATKLELPSQECDFDSGCVWRLYHDGRDLHFYFSSPSFGPAPYKLVRLNRGMTMGEIVMNQKYFGNEAMVCPLEYPADELLVIHKLGLGAGIEVHGCGLVEPSGRGTLFVGHSGAGKSTTARLWAEHSGAASILSDDRIILRETVRGIQVYGTPWHGDAGFSSPRVAHLDRIFVLEHGRENRIKQLDPCSAAAEIFARSFVPFHSRTHIEASLAFLDKVLLKVPCYRFSFLPQKSAVHQVIEFDENRIQA